MTSEADTPERVESVGEKRARAVATRAVSGLFAVSNRSVADAAITAYLRALGTRTPSEAVAEVDRVSERVQQSLQRIADSGFEPGSNRNMMLKPRDARIILAALKEQS